MKYLIVVISILFSINSAHAISSQGTQGLCDKKEYSSICKVDRLKIGLKTVSVKCDTGDAQADSHIRAIPYYAALLTQSNASYMIDLIKTARMKNRRIRVFYSCPAKLNPDGCKKDNCRRLKGIGF